MIRAFSNYMASISPVFIDGLLYCAIAVLMFCQSYFGGDEAAKYITPATKFWLNGALGALATITGALKMFRSNTFAEHQQEKKATSVAATAALGAPRGDTALIGK